MYCDLGQFDLQLGFVGAGAGGEDVEDQLGAVEDFASLMIFSRSRDLVGGQVVVEDDDVGLCWLASLAISSALPLPM